MFENSTQQPNILVIGDLMLDHYLWGKCDRVSPEAPVQVVDIQKQSTLLGGAGNVVNNLNSFGAQVSVFSVVGEDDVSSQMRFMLDNIGVGSFLVIQKHRKTSKKSRIIASNQQVVRYDIESKEDISAQSQEDLLNEFERKCTNFDSIILSDYGKGVLTKELTRKIIQIANTHHIKVLVDPKGSDFSKYFGAYTLTPNKKEASQTTGVTINDEQSLIKALNTLGQKAGVEVPLITLSEDGIAFLDQQNLITKPTVAREVFDVTGAGDTVIAALAYALCLEKSIQKAVEFANLAAGVVVGKIGSATTTLDEIEEYKASLHQSSIQSHIKSFDSIEKVSQALKEKGKKIVFTNGCFDILHRGHVSYLDKAKSFGDVLILGLNSDQSVKRLKGELRPINSQEDRAFLLAALESVDFVVIFESDTPYELIKRVRPDVLVKGGDYQNKEVVGADIADTVKLVDFVDGKSTSNTIKKIQTIQENEKNKGEIK